MVCSRYTHLLMNKTVLLSEYAKGFIEALIDSEGCIYCTKNKARTVRGFGWVVLVTVTNTNKEFLEYARELCGSGGYITMKTPKNKNAKDYYVWRMNPNDARELLPQLRLIVKEGQRCAALYALELLEDHQGGYTPHDEELELLHQEIKSLNSKGRGNGSLKLGTE